MFKRHHWIVLATALPLPAAAAEEDSNEIVFNNHCRQCHSMKAGDNRLGPSLHGIVGKAGGEVEGFNNYSGALKGITWDEATLDKFIASPTSVVSNTNMQFPGVADADDRKKIIEFMKSGGAN